MIMQQIITQVKIAQWLKLLTSIHFVYGREFESQTGKKIFFFFFFLFFFFFFFFVVVVGLLYFLVCFFPNQVCTLCMVLKFLGILSE